MIRATIRHTLIAAVLTLHLGSLSARQAFCQDAARSDNVLSASIDEAVWQTKLLADGVEFRSTHFQNLLGLPQFISLIEIGLDAPGVAIDVVQVDSGRTTTSELGRRSGALAAVNGSYFESDGKPAVFMQSNGTIIRADDDGRSRLSEEGAITTEDSGDLEIIRRSQSVWHGNYSFSDILAAGPLLIWDGEIQEFDDVSFNLTHHPRTAVCATATRKIILLTADGRSAESAGMTTYELALFMQALGCEAALNLDGGGSTTMWLEDGGVVNHPSDNRLFDGAGERAVSNVVIVFID